MVLSEACCVGWCWIVLNVFGCGNWMMLNVVGSCVMALAEMALGVLFG